MGRKPFGNETRRKSDGRTSVGWYLYWRPGEYKPLLESNRNKEPTRRRSARRPPPKHRDESPAGTVSEPPVLLRTRFRLLSRGTRPPRFDGRYAYASSECAYRAERVPPLARIYARPGKYRTFTRHRRSIRRRPSFPRGPPVTLYIGVPRYIYINDASGAPVIY